MKKPIALISVSLIIAGAGIWIFEHMYGTRISNTQLSDRSKTFIHAQGSGRLLEEPESSEPHTISAPECFTLVIPVTVKTARKDGDCDWHILTEQPKMTITTYMQPVTINNLDDDPGIRLRRTRQHMYKEESFTINDQTYLAFLSVSGPSTVTAFAMRGSHMFVVHIQSYAAQDQRALLRKILDSVQFAL